jgi:hypothetical protein
MKMAAAACKAMAAPYPTLIVYIGFTTPVKLPMAEAPRQSILRSMVGRETLASFVLNSATRAFLVNFTISCTKIIMTA